MNRSLRVLLAVAALGALVLMPNAFAATATNTVTVTANVAANCVLTAGTIAFGAYDPVVANATVPLDATSGATFAVRCTRGTAYAVTGAHAATPTRVMTSGALTLNYEIYTDAARTNVWNGTAAGSFTGTAASAATPVTLTLQGRVFAGQDATPAAYTDTVTATVTF